MADIQEFLLTDIKYTDDVVRTTGGDFDTISGIDNLKSAILRRILTTKGSLLHRPNYGASLKKFLNAPTTLATRRALVTEIEEQLQRDDRIEELTGVTFISEDTTPEKITIVIRAKAVGYGEIEVKITPFGEVA